MRLDDEILSAYLDGELSLREREQVARAIAESDELAARLQRLERADAQATALLGEMDSRPLPADVERLLEAGNCEPENEAGERARARVIPFRRPIAALVQGHGWGAALAASLALVIGFGAGLMTGAPESDRLRLALAEQASGTIAPAHPLYAALQEAPSGRDYVVEADGSADMRVTPVLSFRTGEGRYCRELAIEAGARASRGVLCREAGEVWRIRALASIPPSGEGYVPASGEAPPVIEQTIDRLIGGAPLDAEAEARAIENAWRVRD